MQFNEYAIKAKKEKLDSILEHMELLHIVLKRNIGETYEIKHLPRVWEPGGGATLFIVTWKKHKCLLKVKDKDVLVESKLEQENAYMNLPSLANEYNMFKEVGKLGNYVPNILFFDEEENMQFLAVEYIAFSLNERLQQANLAELLQMWMNLYEMIQKIYEAGIVHADLHEYNIRCRSMDSTELVLIDFEESRRIVQEGNFECSLDYQGFNDKSSLGEFPLSSKQPYEVHYNCLLRLREIFKDYVSREIKDFVKECNYDSSNGICNALDHGKSEETYQSINNQYVHILGQRTDEDKRIVLIKELCNILYEQEYIFADIGSNNGLFCREIAKMSKGSVRCLGFEGFSKFNILARALTFLEDCKNIEYFDFVCGEDDISIANINKTCFMAICSVWHHIQKKDVFIQQIKNIDVDYIFFELAVQKECYGGHSWEDELSYIIGELHYKCYMILGYSTDYKRPLVLVAKNMITESQKQTIKSVAERIL